MATLLWTGPVFTISHQVRGMIYISINLELIWAVLGGLESHTTSELDSELQPR